MASANPAFSALIAEYRAEQDRLKTSIQLMEAKTLGVGSPITIPGSINEPTKRFIEALKAGVAELEEAIKILEGHPNA